MKGEVQMAKLNAPQLLMQGSIIKIYLNEDDRKDTIGHEQKKDRPCLVLTNRQFNALSNGMVKVLAISSSADDFPLNIDLPSELQTKGKVLIAQERSFDLTNREFEYVEKVPDDFMDEIKRDILTTL